MNSCIAHPSFPNAGNDDPHKIWETVYHGEYHAHEEKCKPSCFFNIKFWSGAWNKWPLYTLDENFCSGFIHHLF